MNVNLASRNILRNHCKFKRSLKCECFSISTGYRLLPVLYEFSTFSRQQRRSIFLDEFNKKSCQIQSRFLSEESGPPSNKLPQLMPDFPKLVWPSFLKSIKNFILATFIIKPYLDKEFILPDFVTGSKKAVEACSS